MNLIKNMKEKINQLDEKFFLLVENFIPNYVLYLKNPQNSDYIQETDYVFSSIDKINANAFMLMNQMHDEIDKESSITADLTKDMERLKRENALMKEKVKGLKRQSLTAEGMFDDQLDWYRDQLTVVIVMLIGVILGTYFLSTLKLDFKQWFISLAIVIVFGFLFTKLALWIVGKWQKAAGNKMDTIQ